MGILVFPGVGTPTLSVYAHSAYHAGPSFPCEKEGHVLVPGKTGSSVGSVGWFSSNS